MTVSTLISGDIGAEKLYLDRAWLYDWMFHRLLGWRRTLRRFFEAEQYLHSGARVLDVGCGSGAAIRAMVRAAQKKHLKDIVFHGFDSSRIMLDRFTEWTARHKKKHCTIEFREANALALTLPTSWTNYDLIVSSGLLEYIPKKELTGVLRTLRQLLRPHGVFVLFVAKYSTSNRVMQWYWKNALFYADEIRGYLREAGFSSVIMKQLPFPERHVSDWCFVIEATP